MIPAEGNNDDEEIALLYGDAVNPQEDEAAGQLRSRKEQFSRLDERLPSTSEHGRLRGDACTQRRPNMQCLAVFLLRATIVSLAFGVVWYSYELFYMGYVGLPDQTIVVSLASETELIRNGLYGLVLEPL